MQRIRFFDIAKGIAILCVILSHSAIEAQFVVSSHFAKLIVSVCFSFHMPLFFILSGYFMHPERDFRWAKEARQLLCTYLLTGVAVLLGVTCVATIDHGSRRDALRQWGKAVFYGSGDISELTLWPVDFRIGAIWFLLALFWAHLLLHVFAKLPQTPIWVAGCFALGYVSARYIWLPWSLQSGMCAVAFLYIGYLAKQHDVLGLMQRFHWLWLAAGVVWIVDIAFFGGMSMAMNDYGTKPVLAVVGSLAGTLCLVGISECIDKVPVVGSALSLAGRSSLAILCVHLIEDDVLPWQMILVSFHEVLPQVPLTCTAFVMRLPLDLLLAAALYYVPVINEWFYPQLAKKQLGRKAVVDKA
nr:acyltransferase family protein [Bifidobacterium catenulatum]